MRLQDKVAIVTGGSSGFGRATAARLAQEAALIPGDIATAEGAERAVRFAVERFGALGVGNSLTPLNAYMSMAGWLLSGALIRFPNLKLAFSESQVGWIPFLLERLDRVFTRSRAWSDFDASLTELPSSQVPGRVFGCFFDDMIGVDLRHRIGIKQLVFETDYPHQDSDWPNTHALIAEIAERVEPGEIEMLDLDPADLKPQNSARTR